MTFLSMTYQQSLSMSHAIKFYVSSLILAIKKTQMDGLNSYGKEEIVDLKGSEEDISFYIAGKLLSNSEVHHLFFIISFDSDSFFLCQL